MIINLLRDVQLRGAIFEDGARILLRREKANNFIFHVNKFDSLIEIVDKYRLNCNFVKDAFSFFYANDCLCDLVEFVIDDTVARNVLKINFYDVKTRRSDSERKYFETCVSNFEFMKSMQNKGFGAFIVSIILFENWDFSFNVHDYDSVLLRVYDSTIKKTICFQRK